VADKVISAAAVQTLPAGYQVPAAQVIGVKSVRAIVDGSGAGAAFLPALQLVSPAGQIVWQSATDSAIAAGGSADVSWFPGVGAGGAATATGAVITANADCSAPFTWGPGVISRNLSTVITNDSTVFSNHGGFPKEILIQHGGVIEFYTAIEFATNGGVTYSGLFEATVTLRDSLGTDVDEIAGPIIYYAELYATSPLDDFRLSGSTLFNADDTFYTPPYHCFVEFTNSVNSTATSANLTVSIYNPTGLT
jgi:hypothetical protein